MNKLKAWATGLMVSATVAAPSFAQDGTAVSDAASAFATQWAGDAALIGGALIGAAFLAIGFKWVKGMIFN